MISASNNGQRGSAFAKNPARGPIAIAASGWYTFQDHFYDNGGVLAVDMSIYNSSNALVNTWTLGGDAIGTVGGNQYGWFDHNEFSTLAFDNTSLTLNTTAVPEPATLISCGIASVIGLGIAHRRRKARKVAA